MSFSFFTRSAFLGLSVTDGSIEIVEVRRGRGGLVEIAATATLPLESGVVEHGQVMDADRLAAALKRAVASGKPRGFSTNNAYLALPDSVTYFHTFRFPGVLTDAEVSNALSFQAEEIIPFSNEELVTDFLVRKRDASGTVVQYAVALKKAVQQFEAAVTRAGLDLLGLGLEAQGLSRLLVGSVREGHVTLVADIGEHASTIFLREINGLLATFTLPVAGAAMTDALVAAKKLARNKAETLKRSVGLGPAADATVQKALGEPTDLIVEKIGAIFHWQEQAYPKLDLDEVVLAGGTSEMLGFVETVQDRLGLMHPTVKVRKGNPFAGVAESDEVKKLQQQKASAMIAPAIGIAWEGINTKDPWFDFRTNARRHSHSIAGAAAGASLPLRVRFSKTGLTDSLNQLPRRTKTVVAVIFILAAIGALGGAAWWRWQTEQDISSQVRGLDRQRANVLTEEQRIPEVPVDISVGAEEGTVPGRLVVIDAFTKTVELPTRDAHDADGIATGSVTLTNTGARDQALVANTRLLSADGVLFRLDDAVTVSASGTIETTVHADVAGASGNIAPTHFTIPGLPEDQQTIVYADSAAPMTGGIQPAGTVTREDLDAASVAAEAAVRADLASAFNGSLQVGERLLPELTRLTLVSTTPHPAVGESVTGLFTADVVFRMETLAFDEERYRDALAMGVADALGVDVESLDAAGTVKETAVTVPRLSDDLDQASLIVDATFYPQSLGAP